MKKALLVIDIDHSDGWQSDIDGIGYFVNVERKQVALAIKEMLALERARGGLIVFIILITCGGAVGQEAQYGLGNVEVPNPLNLNLKPGGCLVCDIRNEWRLAKFLEHRHESELEPAFIKNGQDAFANKNLERYLRKKNVTEVELVGCRTDQCVQDTATGALKAGFKVTLFAKASYPLEINNEADKSWWIKYAKKSAGISEDQEAAISVVI